MINNPKTFEQSHVTFGMTYTDIIPSFNINSYQKLIELLQNNSILDNNNVLNVEWIPTDNSFLMTTDNMIVENKDTIINQLLSFQIDSAIHKDKQQQLFNDSFPVYNSSLTPLH